MLGVIDRVDNEHKLDKVFDLIVLDDEGQFVALMDFVVSTCLWAQAPVLAIQRSFYDRRVVLYAGLDGMNGRLDMRACLDGMNGRLDIFRLSSASCQGRAQKAEKNSSYSRGGDSV